MRMAAILKLEIKYTCVQLVDEDLKNRPPEKLFHGKAAKLAK
jgi:hypothetical protein